MLAPATMTASDRAGRPEGQPAATTSGALRFMLGNGSCSSAATQTEDTGETRIALGDELFPASDAPCVRGVVPRVGARIFFDLRPRPMRHLSAGTKKPQTSPSGAKSGREFARCRM